MPPLWYSWTESPECLLVQVPRVWHFVSGIMTKFAGKYASKTFRPKDVLPTVVVPQGPVPRASSVGPAAGKFVPGTGAAKPNPQYTGGDVIGIAVMHKSSLQPVFSQREAEESAKMRRG